MCLAALPTHKGINWLLWRCIFIQGQLLQHGVLVRGGVAMGGHYESHNVMFSQGLLRSYLLESKLARWPRVIVSEEVVTEASDYGEMDGQPDGGIYPPPRELLKQDQDGRWVCGLLSIQQPSGSRSCQPVCCTQARNRAGREGVLPAARHL